MASRESRSCFPSCEACGLQERTQMNGSAPGRVSGQQNSAERTMEAHGIVHLPDELREQVERRLARGGPFGQLLSERLRHGNWRIWTILPEGSGYVRGHSLDWGDVASADATTSWLSQCLEAFLRKRPGRVAFFENDPARRDDPWLQTCASKVTYFGDRVFHYVRSGDTSETSETALRDAHSAWILVGAVVESVAMDLRQDLCAEDIEELASSAVALISDAFDGESYIIAEPVDGVSIAQGVNTSW